MRRWNRSVQHGGLARHGRTAAAVVVMVLFAAACGGDDSDTSATTSAVTEPTVATSSSVADETPRTSDGAAAGPTGDAVVLVYNEIGGVDPVSANGTAGNDGQRMFALYGALVVRNSDSGAIDPVLAESLDAGADASAWTLTLREGVTFGDGAVFDAEAVKLNWERAQDPANRSQALAVVSAITAMTVVDSRTLELTLAVPNAHFDAAIAKTALNFIASPAAIEGGQLATEPVGAGPFVLDEWTRDNRMVLHANPDWQGSDGPYVDRLEFRVISDEEQRTDTFLTGDADLFYTNVAAQVHRALDEGAGGYAAAQISGAGTIVFNTEQAPFDDVRVRQAVAMGFDRDVAGDVLRPGTEVANNPVAVDSPLYDGAADYPAYDPDGAQELFDAYIAEHGPIQFQIGSFQQSENVQLAEFIQTALSQFDGVTVTVDVADTPTAYGRVLQGDYQAHLWGFPLQSPDPDLYDALHSNSPTNMSRYSDNEVDALLDDARASNDEAANTALYQQVLVDAATDLPFLHTLHPTFGYVYAENVTGAEVYGDGVLRSDLLRVAE